MNLGQLLQRNLLAHRRRNENSLQRFGLVAQFACVTHADRISFAAFDGRRDPATADGDFNDVLDTANVQSVSLDRIAIDVDFQDTVCRRFGRR